MDLENMFNEEYQGEEADKYVIFSIDNQLFGIHIDYALEIVLVDQITTVPDYPDYAKGVINIRNEVLPIIDLRVIFKKGITEMKEKSHCIITEFSEHKYGILVDSVTDITDFDGKPISDVPKASESYVYSFVIGVSQVGDKLVLILDPSKVFDPSNIPDVQHIQ